MKITIMGLGLSGMAAFQYLKKNKENVLTLIDSKPKNIEGAKFYLEEEEIDLSGEDLIVLSPGIPREHPRLKNVAPHKIISEGELVFKGSDIPIIAITGTNGKTTTTTMMGEAFKKAGMRPFVGGNIGLPIVTYLENKEAYDVMILELSSFQLESMPSLKVKVGIILNVTENHMERYESFSDYKNAKLNLFNNATNETLAILNHDLMNEVKLQNKIEIDVKAMPSFDYSRSKIFFHHNKENLFTVYKTLAHFNVQNRNEIIQELINEFKGVHYRCEFEGESSHYLFYNDAKSTNTSSVVSALNSLSSLKLKINLILGGKLREEKVKIREELLPFKNLIKKIFLIGEASTLLMNELKDEFMTYEVFNLEGVFNCLGESEKSILLFSPGFPSFDQYKDYVERGEHFKKLVVPLIANGSSSF